MGIGYRVFFVDGAGAITRIPARRFERIHDRAEALPRLAGTQVRSAEIMVLLEAGRPTGRFRETYHLLRFDANGLLERDETFKEVRLAMEAFGAIGTFSRGPVPSCRC